MFPKDRRAGVKALRQGCTCWVQGGAQTPGKPQWMSDGRVAGKVITLALVSHCKEFGFDSE